MAHRVLLLASCFASANAAASVTLSIGTNMTTGTKDPITITVNGRTTPYALDYCLLYTKSCADAWNNLQPGLTCPYLQHSGSLGTTDPATATITPEVPPGIIATTLGLTAGDPLPDDEYCVVCAENYGWVKIEMACYTIGTPGAGDGSVTTLIQAAVDDATAGATAAIAGGVGGGVAALILVVVIVMKVKGMGCFAAKGAKAAPTSV